MYISANTRISALQTLDALTMLARMSRKAGQSIYLDSARDIAQKIADGDKRSFHAGGQEVDILRDNAGGQNTTRNEVFIRASSMLESLLSFHREPATVYAILASDLDKAARFLQRDSMREVTLRIFENKAARRAFAGQ